MRDSINADPTLEEFDVYLRLHIGSGGQGAVTH